MMSEHFLIFEPSSSPLSVYGTDVQCIIQATSLTKSSFGLSPFPFHCGRHLSMIPYCKEGEMEKVGSDIQALDRIRISPMGSGGK